MNHFDEEDMEELLLLKRTLLAILFIVSLVLCFGFGLWLFLGMRPEMH